ncbi:MAG: ABC transporter ATP-binding protein [Treponema sp.]
MFKKIRRLIGNEDYKLFINPIKILAFDGVFHGLIYSMLFFTLIDLVTKSMSMQKNFIYLGIMVIALFIRFFLLYSGYYKAQADGARIIAHLRTKMGDYIRKLGLGYFNKNNIGTLSNILTNDLDDFEMLITHLTSDIVKFSILIVYLSICIIYSDFLLGSIQVAIFIFSLPMFFLGSSKIKEAGKEAKIVRADMLSKIIEYVKGIEVFKSYNMLGTRFKKFSEALNGVKKYSIKVELAGIPYLIPMQLLVFLSFPILLYFATQKYFNASLNASQLVIFMVVSLAYTSVSLGLATMLMLSRYFTLSVDKLLSVLETKEIPYSLESYNFEDYSIKFEHVDFSYLEEKQVLKDINFEAKKGTMTALVGASGSGKTTILNLIARFYDVNSGSIKIGGLDIKELNPESLLENITMVFQDVYLIQDTIYENIKIGNQAATHDEVIEAAKKAYADEFIQKFPNGYNTMIHEGGDSLSGGEKQRISIARAFLKDAPIVLLDEATASIDVDNEYLIQNSIKELTKNKTVLVIAHRLNTIRHADQIIVFDEGKIVEKGYHDELIKKNAVYAKMYHAMEEAKEWNIV